MRFIVTSRTPAIASQALGRAGAIGFFAAIFAATAVIPAGPERDAKSPARERLAVSASRVEPFALAPRTNDKPTPKKQTTKTATRGDTADFRAVLGVRAVSSTPAADFIRSIAGGFLPLSFITVSGGDQAPKWGRAKAIPSVEVLDSKLDPFNPDATRARAPGISATITATERLSLSVLALEGKPGPAAANPDIPEWLSKATLALRANVATDSADLSFGGIRKVGAGGDEEPAFFADFSKSFARGKIYGEWESERIDTWKNAATMGFSVDIPWRLKRTIACAGEFRYQEKNEYSKRMIYAEVNGSDLVDGFTMAMTALVAPDANEVILSSGVSQRVGERVKIWANYDYLFDWSDSGVKPGLGKDAPYGYSMKFGVSAVL